MSAHLSPAAGHEFQRPFVFESLFIGGERKKIEPHSSRETESICSPSTSCDTNLFFGFFFDGTGNNYVAAEKTNDYSNIARLYDCFPGMSVPGVLPKSTDWQYKPEQYKHFFRVYVPGPGTRFPQAKDTGIGIDKLAGGASVRWGASHHMSARLGHQQCPPLLPEFPAILQTKSTACFRRSRAVMQTHTQLCGALGMLLGDFPI